MEQRRLLTFSVLVVVTWLGWFSVGPVLFPGLFPPPKPKQQAEDAPAPGEQPDGPVIAQAGNPDELDPGEPAPSQPGDPAEPEVHLPEHPQTSVVLGSLNPDTGYTLAIELTSTGAAIVSATLNDPRYPVAKNPDKLDPPPQLQLLGNNLLVPIDDEGGEKRLAHTFDVDVAVIDSQFQNLDTTASLRTLDWELLETMDDPDAAGTMDTATFRIRSPDEQLEIRKIFRLNRVPADQLQVGNIRDISSLASQLDVELQIRNLSTSKPQVATYVLQGPAGLPLENEENARKFRDIKAGFLSDGSISAETLTAGQLTKNHENEEVETWSQPFRYIGVDTQYFAAIIVPVPAEPQHEQSWFSGSKPTVLKVDKKFRDRSDISVELTSVKLELPPDGVVEHRFQMFLGPKRRELLETYEADAIIDFGWFAAISHVMVWLLDTFHGWGAPYGVAIIMLTMIVRGCMFPISKKQALSAKKMKELQPQLTEIREKFKDDKQKLAQAQMELYRKASFNPLAGCLPVFLQLPIFIALYQALNNWVDLRMAPFLWVDNLAAPDALTSMPTLPFLGSDFNLLPILTVCLFYAQQKMFMPPATTAEQAMQYKMMNGMMFIFGFMFYHVPAGLCVYFIASSLWGMSERKLLEFLPEKPVDEEALKNKPPKKDGFLARLFKQLQEAAEMQQQVEAQRGGQGAGNTPPQRPGQTGNKRGGGKRGKGRR